MRKEFCKSNAQVFRSVLICYLLETEVSGFCLRKSIKEDRGCLRKTRANEVGLVAKTLEGIGTCQANIQLGIDFAPCR